MEHTALQHYWMAPVRRKGVSHAGEHLLNKGYLAHVLGLDEGQHLKFLSVLLQRNISSLSEIEILSQGDWDIVHAAQKECAHAIRRDRHLPLVRAALIETHPGWNV